MKSVVINGLFELRFSRPYVELLREHAMSVGLYVLPAGAIDGQSPHTEDEVYVVMSGSAKFSAGDVSRSVGAGDAIFVEAGTPHRFHDITDELRLVVMFAPPEGSQQAG